VHTKPLTIVTDSHTKRVYGHLLDGVQDPSSVLPSRPMTEPTYWQTLYVYDDQLNTPIEGALINAGGELVHTRADGRADVKVTEGTLIQVLVQGYVAPMYRAPNYSWQHGFRLTREKPTVIPAQRLHVSGGHFRTPQGTIWKYRGRDGYAALWHALRGDWGLLDRHAAHVRDHAGTVVRVFLTWQNLLLKAGRYDVVDQLLGFYNDRGLVVHVVAACDQRDLLPEQRQWLADNPEIARRFLSINGRMPQDDDSVAMPFDQWVTHIQTIAEIVRGRATVNELNNEDWQYGNVAHLADPSWLGGAPWTRSAFSNDELPIARGSFLDWTTHHLPRDHEWPRKGKELLDVAREGFPGHAPTGLPAVAGEPIRTDDGNATNAQDYGDFAALCELMGAGCCVHEGFVSLDPIECKSDGQFCTVPPAGSHEEACILAAERAWRAGINPELSVSGVYKRGPWDDCPLVHSDETALRTFAMIQGDQAVAVVVRPTTSHRPQAQDGWRIDRQVDNLYFLSR
jgi:hypothetical protein